VKALLLQRKRIWAFAVLVVVFALLPVLVKSPYYIDLLILLMINAVLAMTFVMMLRTGLISLAVAAFWGIGAYASAMLSMHAHLSFWACLPLATLITAIFAFIIGFVIIRNAGFTFVIMTTVIAMLFVVAVGNIQSLGGYNGVSSIPAPDSISFGGLGSIVFDSKVDFFYLGLVLFVIAMLVINAFYSSWAGRAWNAIGLNSRLAQSMGVNVFRYRLASFVVACAIAGLMGSFYAHYQTFIIPTAFNLFPKTIYIQVFAVLGGVGFATLGPIVGAGLLTVFNEVFSKYAELSTIIVGALVLVVVVFLPQGLLSLGSLPSRIRGWRRRPKEGDYELEEDASRLETAPERTSEGASAPPGEADTEGGASQ
jgi:branched-chain amino acid transport system permease protein